MNTSFCNETVSFIIRACNSDRTFLLREAIKSIRQNTYRAIEIIVVIQSKNENFIQEVKNLISEYQEKDFTGSIIVNRTSQDERSKNMNLGLQQAKGRYISFLDEDDIIYPDLVEKLLRPLQKTSEYAWSYGNFALASCYVDNSQKVQKREIEYPFSEIEFSLDRLLDSNFIQLNCCLLDRCRLDAGLIQFNESFIRAEDYEFLLRVSLNYKPFHVKDIVAEYRIYEDMNNTNAMMNSILGIPDKDKIQAWDYALWRIEILKESLFPEYRQGIISLKTRKYIFYKFPELKIFLQYRVPGLRKRLIGIASFFRLMPNYNKQK
jgi:glycosyltransferase involved in cell wall biosynthesis